MVHTYHTYSFLRSTYHQRALGLQIIIAELILAFRNHFRTRNQEKRRASTEEEKGETKEGEEVVVLTDSSSPHCLSSSGKQTHFSSKCN